MEWCRCNFQMDFFKFNSLCLSQFIFWCLCRNASCGFIAKEKLQGITTLKYVFFSRIKNHLLWDILRSVTSYCFQECFFVIISQNFYNFGMSRDRLVTHCIFGKSFYLPKSHPFQFKYWWTLPFLNIPDAPLYCHTIKEFPLILIWEILKNSCLLQSRDLAESIARPYCLFRI